MVSEKQARRCVATFHATYAVLKAEKLLKARGIAVKMIPVPREISSNCGISVRFHCEDMEKVREAVSVLADDLEGFFAMGDDRRYHKV